MYLVIQQDEDNPCTFLDDIDDILENPRDYCIDNFLQELPKEKDPNYWNSGDALLLEVKVLKPVVKATAFMLED